MLVRSLVGSTIFACLGVALAHAAKAEEVQRKLDAAATGTVSIENTAGSVTVEGWSKSEVEVSGDLGRDVDELVFERDGNVVNVHVRSRRSSGRAVDTDLVVRVPERSAIKIGGVSIDIEIEGVMGSQRLSTVSGDVSSHAYEADVDIETVSGDIDVRGNGRGSARAHMNTVSGDIDVQGMAGEIEITSVSGDLVVSGGRWSRVKANTTSGDFDFEGELLERGRLDFETINGDMEVMFRGELSAEVDIETFNGSINNCFGPKATRTSRYAPGRELKFTEGEGSGRVTIRTLNGDLRMCKD